MSTASSRPMTAGDEVRETLGRARPRNYADSIENLVAGDFTAGRAPLAIKERLAAVD